MRYDENECVSRMVAHLAFRCAVLLCGVCVNRASRNCDDATQQRMSQALKEFWRGKITKIEVLSRMHSVLQHNGQATRVRVSRHQGDYCFNLYNT